MAACNHLTLLSFKGLSPVHSDTTQLSSTSLWLVSLCTRPSCSCNSMTPCTAGDFWLYFPKHLAFGARLYCILDDFCVFCFYASCPLCCKKANRAYRYNPNHVLHRLLPQPKNTGYKLHQRTHDLTLPTDINAVTKQNFVYRMLFRDIY